MSVQNIENKYFADINCYKKIAHQSNVFISPYVPYQKSLHLNRAVISGANGLIKLSIPLFKGRDQKTPFGRVRVALEKNWKKDHWKAIVSSYNKSPWFEHFYDIMASYYKNDLDLLFDWNLESFNIVKSILGHNMHASLADQPPHPTQRFDSDRYDLEREIQGEDTWKTYPQVFEDRFGFVPNLSILDLIFCMGPNGSWKYLTTT